MSKTRTVTAPLALALLVAGCAHSGTHFGPEEPAAAAPAETRGHLRPPQEPAGGAPRVVASPPHPPEPPPVPAEERYTVAVRQVPVRELLFSLARDAGLELDVHPELQGAVTLYAESQPLPRILERLERQTPLRLERSPGYLAAFPDTPFFRIYHIGYLNLARSTNSRVQIATQIATTGSAASPDEGLGTTGVNNSTTDVSGSAELDFWATLAGNLRALLGVATDDGAAAVIPNAAAGVVAVRATGAQHRTVRRFLSEVLESARRQVLIRATIVEVALSDRYQSGIEWSFLERGSGVELEWTSLGETPAQTVSSLVLRYEDGDSSGNEISATLRLLQEFGDTRVLSSPQLMALNNQTALLKVVDNIVYFTVEQETTLSVQGSSESASRSEVHSVPVGLVMSVTPYVDAGGAVILSVRPTISRVNRFVSDPNPILRENGSRIPEIQVRELESLLRLEDGEVAVLGGLIQDDRGSDQRQVPGLAKLPWIGRLFSSKGRNSRRTELVILLRPAVIEAGRGAETPRPEAEQG
ncbi:MAG: pilus (MSHA type) biogenesis protein MshL [Gammaproteobacteria bacterium]|nr:pilus (MSHA type) biogenesis protein MshL [Gammaproteobacteria bacterium]